MKLHDVVTKLKNARLKAADLRPADMDRAGDLLIALMLAAALTGVTLAVLYGAGALPGFPFTH
jgi:hypothetical protein